jgi:hypothetical protein
MWEYARIEINIKNIGDLMTKLNEIGNDNWEIFSYQENKPIKYCDDWHVTIIAKRLKLA